jgi:hypothetical protein
MRYHSQILIQPESPKFCLISFIKTDANADQKRFYAIFTVLGTIPGYFRNYK